MPSSKLMLILGLALVAILSLGNIAHSASSAYDVFTATLSSSGSVNYQNSPGPRNFGIGNINNITEPAQFLTLTSQIPNAFSYGQASSSVSSSVLYDLVPYQLNEIATSGVISGAATYIYVNTTPLFSGLVNGNNRLTITVYGYQTSTSPFPVSNSSTISVIGATAPAQGTFIARLYNVTKITVSEAIPNLTVSVTSSATGSTTGVMAKLNALGPQILIPSSSQPYAYATLGNEAIVYNQQNGQPTNLFGLAGMHPGTSSPYPLFEFSVEENPVAGQSSTDGLAFELRNSTAGAVAAAGTLFQMNYSAGGPPNNITYFYSTFGAANVKAGFITEKGSKVVSISPTSIVLDLAETYPTTTTTIPTTSTSVTTSIPTTSTASTSIITTSTTISTVPTTTTTYPNMNTCPSQTIYVGQSAVCGPYTVQFAAFNQPNPTAAYQAHLVVYLNGVSVVSSYANQNTTDNLQPLGCPVILQVGQISAGASPSQQWVQVGISYQPPPSTTTTSTTTSTTTTSISPSTTFTSTLTSTIPSTTVPVPTTTVPSYPTYTLTLNKGWNLFSVPLEYATRINSTCAPGTIASPIWQLVNGQYVQSSYIYGGIGYWVKSNNECLVTFSGPVMTTDELSSLSPGWNMIGAPVSQIAFSYLAGTCSAKSLMGYSPTLNRYYNVSISSTQNQTGLSPGNGYFINVLGVCKLGIVLPSGSSSLPPPPPT